MGAWGDLMNKRHVLCMCIYAALSMLVVIMASIGVAYFAGSLVMDPPTWSEVHGVGGPVEPARLPGGNPWH